MSVPNPLPRAVCPRCAGLKVELADLADKQIVAAYQRTDGEPGNPEADALLCEIERRGLDL